MQDKAVTVSFPAWLIEAAQATAQQRGIYFEDMLRLTAYEYVEKHSPDRLSFSEGVPAYVRVANALLADAIDKRATVVHLVSRGSNLCVIIQTDEERAIEMMSLPPQMKPHLYDRFVTMASDKSGMRNSIPISHHGEDHQILLSWSGDYGSEMVLHIIKLGIGNGGAKP